MRLPTLRIPSWDEKYLPVLNDSLDKIKQMFENKIEPEDNMFCDFIEFTASGAAGTAHTLAHTLGKVPAGFIVICSLSGTTFGSGGGAWDATDIYLKSITLGGGETDTVEIMVF